MKLFEVFEDDKNVYMVMEPWLDSPTTPTALPRKKPAQELCRDGDLEEHVQELGCSKLVYQICVQIAPKPSPLP